MNATISYNRQNIQLIMLEVENAQFHGDLFRDCSRRKES